MENNEVDTCKLLYNTERVTLYIPEYGRNVQKMVDYLKTIEDRQKRNEQARAIIKVMEIINPAVHHQDDYEHKLWDHLHIISGFDLDVDSPYPAPAPESLHQQPLPVPLNKTPLKATHYGRNIENRTLFRMRPSFRILKGCLITESVFRRAYSCQKVRQNRMDSTGTATIRTRISQISAIRMARTGNRENSVHGKG